ncbi:MAG: formate dehydrogenase accessory protein FdhE [Candidatus Desulfofervidaceae bacterium]|nr:formate dehydrogenase accessory protein FdhE [Candidatus Desulfofervidaceae bacterium]
MSDNSLKNFQYRLENLKKKYPMYENFFNFYGSVLLTRKNFSQKPQIESVVVEEEMAKLKLKEGFPLLEKAAFNVDLEHAQLLFFTLCDKLKDVKEVKSAAEKINSYFLQHPEALKKVFIAFLKENEIDQIDLDFNLLKFLVFHSLKPSLEICVQGLKQKLEGKTWMKGYCPICGHYPYIAALRENGKKFVRCSFCGYEWSIERIFCPFCGNKNHEKLKYFEVEGEEGYRVYVCEECKRYLKTVDENKIENVVDLDLEDIATLHLDILAEKEGYKKEAEA